MTMADQDTTLDELRREIDRIDDALHDLLMQRTEVVHAIGLAKGGPKPGAKAPVFLRPGREAEVVRRLVARHRGAFPKIALVRIWRELMSALVGLQGPFSIAVTMPESGEDYMELARNQYGTAVPVSSFRTPGQVVRAVADGSATVGIVPVPDRGGPEALAAADAWWLALMAKDMPRIIARLPFANPDPGRPDALEAMAIARLSNDSTGFDRTWLAVETESDVSRARLKTLLGAAGLEPSLFAATHRGEEHWLHMVEVIGHVAEDDRRATRLVEKKGQVTRAVVLGGHAVPLGAEELGD